MSNTIALIAHNSRKDDIVRFAFTHAPTLSRYPLISTMRTGEQIQAATGLTIEQKLTASLGGIIQIAAEVANGNILAAIFLVDSIAASSDPNLDTLLQICNVYNVAIATNLATM